MAAHSPFCSVLARSQFATKSLFVSVHDRVVLIVVRISGLRSRSVLVAEKASIYLPEVDLERRLAVAEQVVGRARPRR